MQESRRFRCSISCSSKSGLRGAQRRIGEEVGEVLGVVERHRLRRGLRGAQRAADLAAVLGSELEALRDLVAGRVAAEVLAQLRLGRAPAVDELDHVGRDADRAHGVDERAPDALLDPPRRVGREAALGGGVEALDGAHQSEVALLDQVEERQAAIVVVLRDADDEAEVRADELLARLGIALLHAVRELDLLLRGEERHVVDVAQVGLQRADAGNVVTPRRRGAPRRRLRRADAPEGGHRFHARVSLKAVAAGAKLPPPRRRGGARTGIGQESGWIVG